MTAFVDLYRSRESRELLRFKGRAKSQYMGFTVKMFEYIVSEWAPPSARLPPLSIIARFPLCAATILSSPLLSVTIVGLA